MRANSVPQPTYYVPECPDGWVAVGHTVLDAKGRVLAMCANGEVAAYMAQAQNALGLLAVLEELSRSEPLWAAATEAVYQTVRGDLGLWEEADGILDALQAALTACQGVRPALS